MRKSTDFLRRIIGVTLSYVCSHCIWWVSTGHGDGNNRKKKHCNWWCAACGGQYEWIAPSGYWWCKSEPTQTERKSSKRTQHRWSLCDNLTNEPNLSANQQKDGDSPIQSITTGLRERSRRGIMDGLRRFIEADNHSGVDVRDLRRGTVQRGFSRRSTEKELTS